MVTPFYSVRCAFLRFASLFRKQQLDRELSDELESHLQFHTEENLRNGMSSSQARRQAVLKLGGIEPTKENYRDLRGIPFLENLMQDFRFAFRIFRKSPGFSAVVVLTLAGAPL